MYWSAIFLFVISFAGDSDTSSKTSSLQSPSPLFSTSAAFAKPISQQPSSSTTSAAEEVMKVMTQPKKTVPEPDYFAKRKKKADEEFMQSMKDSNKALVHVAEKMVVAVSGAAPVDATAAAPPQDPIIGAIQFALQSVSQEDKLACLMDVLKLITEKYVRK